MTAILERRENSSLWARFCEWITSTENRCAGMNVGGTY
jgi:photosystem II P680 reaction center D1 protein